MQLGLANLHDIWNNLKTSSLGKTLLSIIEIWEASNHNAPTKELHLYVDHDGSKKGNCSIQGNMPG